MIALRKAHSVTWHIDVPQGLDTHNWIAFTGDHRFVWFYADGNGEGIDDRGSWYAGGKHLYMRREGDGKKYVWNIIEVLPNELRLRYEKIDYVLRRDDQKSTPSI